MKKTKRLTKGELAIIKRFEMGKICTVCGEPMTNFKVKFCSDKCQRKSYDERKNKSIVS